jgi:ferredoxin--NADP+ reductase/benzoate/toluate 1,2-dioxygenase reductase subunit
VSVGVRGAIEMREYSIYSSVEDDRLEILVREVEHGHVSRDLRRLQPGDEVEVAGPFGFFVIDENHVATRSFLFVATGTGISPFHSFVTSHPGLDYRLIHGVRTPDELYDHERFDEARCVSCISRLPEEVSRRNEAVGRSGETGEVWYPGRVTDYLREHPTDAGTLCYLCGNCDMIYEVFDILKAQGVEPDQLFAEVYF